MRGIFLQYDIRHIFSKKNCEQSQGINKVVEGKTRWFEIIDAIDTYINYYNNDNHHSGPKNIGLTNSTPKQIFNDPLRQTTDRQHTPFNVDGQKKSFSEFCKEKDYHKYSKLLQIENLLK